MITSTSELTLKFSNLDVEKINEKISDSIYELKKVEMNIFNFNGETMINFILFWGEELDYNEFNEVDSVSFVASKVGSVSTEIDLCLALNRDKEVVDVITKGIFVERTQTNYVAALTHFRKVD